MSGKRKKASGENETTKRPKTDGIFFEKKFYLHPAALTKARRGIFEKQIASHGGELVKSSDGCDIVLIEDNMIEKEKLQNIVDKLAKEAKNNLAVLYLGLSWLSQCLEEDAYVATEKFVVKGTTLPKKKPTAATTTTSSSSTGQGSADQTGASKTVQGSYIDRNKHKFVCARSSDDPDRARNHNKAITDELEKLAAAYKSSNDTWRAFGYQKAISALKNHPRAVTSREEASEIPNVGKKMAEKIVEILEDGGLRKVDEVCNSEKVRVVDLFNRVWGVGPTTAEKWYEQGLRTLEDLREKASLNRQQEVGLRLFHDLDERMEREECTEIYEVVKKAALEIQEGLELIACGSYRRGKPTCGDLDILVTHPDRSALEDVFEKLLASLHKTGFLTDDLSKHRDGRQQKYLGVCRLARPGAKHRRLDIIVVPPEERAPALMYFTGSAHFNRSMRLLAIKMGMSLSEHSLDTNVVRHQKEKMNEGEPLETPTEESIFEHLGLPYRAPHERNH